MGGLSVDDCYEVLGLPAGAGDAAVKAAFRKLALIHHPDKATYDKEEATRRFQAIAEAFEVLSDPELRAKLQRAQRRTRTDPSAQRSSGPSAPRGAFRPRPMGRDTSLAEERRARVAAHMERDRQKLEEKSRQLEANQRVEQNNYEELKRSMHRRLSEASGDGAGDSDDQRSMDELRRMVKEKWLNMAWEEKLPGHDLSKGLRDMLIRDVASERRARRASTGDLGGDAADGAGDGVEDASPMQPRPKRKVSERLGAQGPPATSPDGLVTDAVNLELQRSLRGMGFSEASATDAARNTSSVPEAIQWISDRARERNARR